ncbi:hypothetical protein M0R45_038231 [Rubus argutus]|uniref:Pentatricopeptide repeat-containing protein n=1 Tax=Rubus argutus TaxID=59490 RepID=A0AAW1W4Y4_RUBAR
MALSKPTFLAHLKTLAKPPHRHHRPTPPSFISLRFLSFATPEDAAAERRRRKRPPPHGSPHQLSPPHPTKTAIAGPETAATTKPERPQITPNPFRLSPATASPSTTAFSLSSAQNDLEEAALFTRHSIYSNCRPTIYTVNSVLAAQLRQSKYSDLLSLHRFITQAGVAPNIITHNLIFQTYLDCRKPDTAMEHYKQLINEAPFNPSPTTYRILIKGLVDNNKLDKALELKEEIDVKGFQPDPVCTTI